MRLGVWALGVLGFVGACASHPDSGSAGGGGSAGSIQSVGGGESAGSAAIAGATSSPQGGGGEGNSSGHAGENAGPSAGSSGAAGAAGSGHGGEPAGGAAGGDETAGASGSAGGGELAGSGGTAGDAGSAGVAGTAGMGGTGGASGGAGMAGSAGTAGSGGTGAVSLIAPEQTMFRDYGSLRIAFTQAVNAATLQITLSPTVPSALLVTTVTQVDPTTVDATLAFYHLPRDYQVDVTGQLASGGAFQASALIPGLNNGSRVAFQSRGFGSGIAYSWFGLPGTATTPLEAMDSLCQTEAGYFGLRGTFVAFLSAHGVFNQNNYDAGCRMFGLLGTLAEHCGQATLPVDHAPWLDLSGLPIVDGATNIVANNWLTPIPSEADGSRLIGSVSAWTGTGEGAVGTGLDCNGWTDTSDTASSTNYSWGFLPTYGPISTCDTNKNILCFQVGGSFFGPSTLHQVSGKRAFVSKGKVTGAMSFGGKTGLAAADALCQSEATSAGYANVANFRAYLSTSNDDAICHVLGKTGKMASSCGLTALPSSDPWRRADNYPIGTAAQLTSGILTAPLSLAPDGSQQLTVQPWTGTGLYGDAEDTCGDWTSAASTDTTPVGSPRATSGNFSLEILGPCNVSNPLYCFEH
jgi:hypothetical protein